MGNKSALFISLKPFNGMYLEKPKEVNLMFNLEKWKVILTMRYRKLATELILKSFEQSN